MDLEPSRVLRTGTRSPRGWCGNRALSQITWIFLYRRSRRRRSSRCLHEQRTVTPLLRGPPRSPRPARSASGSTPTGGSSRLVPGVWTVAWRPTGIHIRPDLGVGRGSRPRPARPPSRRRGGPPGEPAVQPTSHAAAPHSAEGPAGAAGRPCGPGAAIRRTVSRLAVHAVPLVEQQRRGARRTSGCGGNRNREGSFPESPSW